MFNAEGDPSGSNVALYCSSAKEKLYSKPMAHAFTMISLH